MKYLSIDIETTGLNPETCNIIEIGAVADDTERLDIPLEELNTFHCYVVHDIYQGEPYALSMHSKIFRRIATRLSDENRVFKFYRFSQVSKALSNWITNLGGVWNTTTNKLTIAGKNFGSFDLQFLKKLPEFDSEIKYHHRFIDPGMLFWNPLTDSVIPNQSECLKRIGENSTVAHTALEDAFDVVKLVRYHIIRNNNLNCCMII